MNPRYQLYKKLNLIVFSYFIFHSATIAQSLDWAKSIGGNGLNQESGNSMSVDNSGNIYTTGSFRGTVDFDPNAGIYNLTAAGGSDIYIQKLDSEGNFIWAKSMGSIYDDSGSALTLDNLGNVYTTGYFANTVDFDPGAGIYNLTAPGWTEIYIQKLDATGNFIWVKSMGGAGNSQNSGNAITLDNLGNIYTTGSFSSTVDFNLGAGIYNLTAAGGSDIYIQKLDVTGNFIWAKSFGGYWSDIVNGITVDNWGNVYTTGQFRDVVDFDPTIGVFNITSQGYHDIFISKFDSTGSFIWAKSMGSIYDDSGNGITVDDWGNIYTTGYYSGLNSGLIDFDPNAGIYNLNGSGIFIQKLSSAGNFIWVKSMIEGVSFGAYSHSSGNSIALDSSNNIYTTGHFANTVDFDPNLGNFHLSSASEWISDIFIQKLDSAGNFIWARSMGGVGEDHGDATTVDGFGNIYITGKYENIADFDPNFSYFYLSNTSGGQDVFVQKLSSCPPNIDVIYACSSYTWIDGNTYTASNNTATYPITGSGGCDSIMILNLTINDITITVNDPTIVTNLEGDSITYQWLDCLNNYAIMPGETSQYSTFLLSGTYAVEVTQNGCKDTSSCVNVTLLPMGNQQIKHGLNTVSIFPNPSEGLVTIKLEDNKLTSIKVLSINGTLIYQKENINSSTYQVELTEESSGIYIIEINTEQERQFFKLIKN